MTRPADEREEGRTTAEFGAFLKAVEREALFLESGPISFDAPAARRLAAILRSFMSMLGELDAKLVANERAARSAAPAGSEGTGTLVAYLCQKTGKSGTVYSTLEFGNKHYERTLEILKEFYTGVEPLYAFYGAAVQSAATPSETNAESET